MATLWMADLQRLVMHASGVRVDARGHSVAELVDLVVASHGDHRCPQGVALHSCMHLSFDDRLRIAEAASGCVFFDD